MSTRKQFEREKWGLEKVIFAVQIPESRYRSQVFAAREREMEQAEATVMDAPRNVLVSGLFGIGKTFFLIELLDNLKRQYNGDVLTIYENLTSVDSSIATTILRGLAKALRDEDVEAARIDQLLSGIQITSQTADKTGGSGEIGIPNILKFGANTDSTTTDSWKRDAVLNAAEEARNLIERATKRQPERRLVVALDDLDKRDPATIRQELVATRPLLHSECAFLMTGHPLGVLRNIYSTAGGVFDQELELEVMSASEMRTIMHHYLQAARIPNTTYSDLHPFTPQAADVIIESSLGIPRLLNKICRHILDCAAEMRSPVVDVDVLRQCWLRVERNLRSAMTEDIARFMEVLQERTNGFDPLNIPDDVYDRLGVDSHQGMLSKINSAIYGGYAVGTEVNGEPRITAIPLLEAPPTLIE